ncbi:MAG: Rieske 2Fe-2S domain-containing protein [Deinococcus sp.]|nr:Rieske 2Fe-2S domain-containing protein [Deinococcus sp.]
MPKVKFVPQNLELEVPPGANLRQVLLRNKQPVYSRITQFTNCRGHGLCGTCWVEVDPTSQLSQRTFREKLKLSGRGDSVRLSCQTRVLGDCTVQATAGSLDLASDPTGAKSRRELFGLAWSAGTSLFLAQFGVVSVWFMWPRFKAGEFGGKFDLGPFDQLEVDRMYPDYRQTGRFWLIRLPDRLRSADEKETPQGLLALYTTCTHLGCKPEWVAVNNRFECPCHGSKFQKDGTYISGPAPRGLDRFEVTLDRDGNVIVDTGRLVRGQPHGVDNIKRQDT